MNERMIELVNKANSQVGYTFKLEDADQIHTLVEKFAELIVRECASIDFRHKIGLTSDQDYEVSNIIKEHFGVKE